MSDIQNSTVSVVVPTLGHPERLRVSLPPLVRALEARGFEPDEILVVDDSGDERAAAVVPEVLGSLDAARSGSVRVIASGGADGAAVGFARAVTKGAERARGSLLMVCQDDVALHEGALKALARAMRDEDVFAAGPVLRQSVETKPAAEGSRVVPQVRLVDDRVEVREVHLAGEAPELERATFVPSTCVMVRRSPFLALGGFDALFAPFGWEDVDLGIAARRRGLRVVRVGDAVATHHGDLPSIWDGLDEDLCDAVVERNRLLLRWKHLATRGEATGHLVSLWRQVLEAGLAGDRRVLERACLAFDRLPEVTASRQKLAGTVAELADVI